MFGAGLGSVLLLRLETSYLSQCAQTASNLQKCENSVQHRPIFAFLSMKWGDFPPFCRRMGLKLRGLGVFFFFCLLWQPISTILTEK